MANIGNIKNFFVDWFDESDDYNTTTEITDDVLGISFTDTGSGRVNECTLKLTGAFGNFITDKGDKTVIDQFDRFRVRAEDLKGNTYDRHFEFNPLIIPSQTKTEGTILELNLIGLEYHTQRVSFAGRFWFSDAFRVAREIGSSYNENRDARQPELSSSSIANGYSQSGNKTGNGFPKFTINHYEYGLVEESGYNRWRQMLEKFGGSVSAGGILDFFELGFETTSVKTMDIAIFLSGSRSIDLDDDANLPTIIQSLDVNVGSTDVGIAAATASQVAAWGSQTHGSLPTGHSKYVSGVDQFIFRAQWDADILYLKDSRVKYFDNKHFKAKNNITGTPPFTPPPNDATNWEQIDMGDEFGDSIQYSEWTDDKVREWVNCGANPRDVIQVNEVITPDTSGDKIGAAMFDSNIVILDTTDEAKFFRTWVDFRIINNFGVEVKTIQQGADNWAYSGNTSQFPVGRRMLVDGTTNVGFTGDDSNGIPFSNNIAEWVGEEWIVKYRPANTGVDLNNMQVAVIDEALLYQFDQPTVTWSIVTGDLANDCFHDFTSVKSAPSFDPKPTETDSANHPHVSKNNGIFTTNEFSALEFRYEVLENFQDRFLAGSEDPLGSFFRKGAWAVWRVPFSPNNYGTGVTVGKIYGTATPAVGEDNLQPSFLDTQNMTRTSRGTRGFNQDNSEDLGQLQELAGIIKIENKSLSPIAPTGTFNIDGIITVRIWMIDRYDNTVFYDVEIPFVNVFYPIKIPLSAFKIYRGKIPRRFAISGNEINSLILPQELEIYNRFAFREIQMVGFQVQNFYDEFGRYAPDGLNEILDFEVSTTSFSKILGGKFAITIDDFHFTKPLLAIARQPGDDRNLEAQFRKRPQIITFQQLLNDAETELEKEQFQLKQYQIETAGEEVFGLKFGDAFFFENNQLVNNQDDTSAGNTNKKRIKLVTKHIQYNLTAPGTGEGGFTRTITSVKRFE